MIVTTEAVVLKSMKYHETSKIVTLYTRAFGKISVLAKGARDRKSRFGASLEPMCHVAAVLYTKESRELQLLSQCDTVESFPRLTEDLDRMAAGMAAVELVNAATHAEEENAALFGLLVDTLKAINSATKNPVNALYYYEMHLLGILGFKPNLHSCVQCGRPIDVTDAGSGKGGVRMSSAGLVCPECSSKGVGFESISAPAARILQRLQEVEDGESVTRISMPPNVRREVEVSLRRLLLTHLEGMKRLKSESVFSSIM